MPVIPTSLDILARFIYSDRHFKVSDQTVKHAAFLPNRNNNKTSVFRVTGLLESEIWDIESSNDTGKRIESLKARADVAAGDVTSQNLDLIPQEPPERHIDITGWSKDKSENKLKAIELAKQATLFLAPSKTL